MNAEMACVGDTEYPEIKEMDSNVEEAFQHLYDVCTAIEQQCGMRLLTTRSKIRFIELSYFNAVNK